VGGRGRGREVGRHGEPDRRLHLQHGLRAGGGRRAAGEPHALRHVLPPRSATSSSRARGSSSSATADAVRRARAAAVRRAARA
jgi:hypothetical protein